MSVFMGYAVYSQYAGINFALHVDLSFAQNVAC